VGKLIGSNLYPSGMAGMGVGGYYNLTVNPQKIYIRHTNIRSS